MTGTDDDRFRNLVERHFRFLTERGFRRVPEDESRSPVGSAVVFAGRHVGFLISYDARDRVVDVRVVRVRDGRVLPLGEGGDTRDLYAYLVEHAGYRGSPLPAEGLRPAADALERQVAGAARLLEGEGGALLEDEPDALPRGKPTED